MHVVLPFAGEVDPRVPGALTYPFEPVDVSCTDTRYWELLAELWADGADVCVVEHDIVVGSDTLSMFEDCACEWGACEYPYMGGHYAGLGCTRFRGSLLRRHPGVLDHVGQYQVGDHPRKHWCVLDGLIKRHLESLDYRLCVHGRVDHLGSQLPSHGCVQLATG